MGSAFGRKSKCASNQSTTTVVHVCSEQDLRPYTEMWQNALREVYGDYLDCLSGRNRWSLTPPRSGFTSRTDYRECSPLPGILVAAVVIELIFRLRVNVVVH